MKRILTAVILIPLVIVLVFAGPDWLVTLATAAVALLAAWEYLGIAAHAGAKPPRIPVLVAIALLFLTWLRWPELLTEAVGALALALFVYCAFSAQKTVQRVLPDSATAVFTLVYTGLTLLALPALRHSEEGKTLVTFLLCVVWAGDIAALYIGRAWGRRKLTSLSPNKTWEGSIGSVLGSLAVTAGLIALSRQLVAHDVVALVFPGSVAYWLLLAVVVNIAAQVGDLVESALKRSAGVKDSGTLLPGHGGVLDRIDALLLAAPVLWYAQVIQRF
jgi:phosphatidate cytidylyltransferase